MAKDETASIVQLRQPRPKTAKTPAERARAYRARKRGEPPLVSLPAPVSTSVAPPPPLQPVTLAPVKPSRHVAPHLLTLAALGLAGVGVTMNAWFARSLGSTDMAGYLFLAVGMAADIAALALPSVAARHWQARQRTTAAAGWLVWLMTFVFAVTAGIGFASVNITDVALRRSSRITPAVTAAQLALGDGMAARDRECRGGVGRFCRDREQAVIDLRKVLDSAMASVASTADPQTQAATRIVAWATMSRVQPTENDFAMLRLALLALLPQIGGVLLMVAREKGR